MNDTTRIPEGASADETSADGAGADNTGATDVTDLFAPTSPTSPTEVLDDTEPPVAVVRRSDAARPRVRIGAVVWGLFVSIVTTVTIVTVLDPLRSREFSYWAGNVSSESIGLIALIALGSLILLLGLVSLLRQAQRRGEHD